MRTLIPRGKPSVTSRRCSGRAWASTSSKRDGSTGGLDPWSRMGYSSVPPGGVGLRSKLGEPIDNVLQFAGEAVNPVRPATVHGAIESGAIAAARVLSA